MSTPAGTASVGGALGVSPTAVPSTITAADVEVMRIERNDGLLALTIFMVGVAGGMIMHRSCRKKEGA
jgi:hypothetical protein